ncbi:hypothetical protein [Silanimonas sp.]|jgi:hypothetical protein|uniref:hypothetical protein n=1 Tax=Silanimonas sp. TaxID=1929290 RepID=UPI002630264E|nr:hypothetical protein [Silanimonas sp.]
MNLTVRTWIAAAALLAIATPAAHADAVIDAAACTISVDGKTFPLAGKVQYVDTFPDFTIRWVDSFADLHVKDVDAFADDCGEWQEVDAFPDFKVKVVDAFEDLKIRRVDAFPGAQ